MACVLNVHAITVTISETEDPVDLTIVSTEEEGRPMESKYMTGGWSVD